MLSVNVVWNTGVPVAGCRLAGGEGVKPDWESYTDLPGMRGVYLRYSTWGQVANVLTSGRVPGGFDEYNNPRPLGDGRDDESRKQWQAYVARGLGVDVVDVLCWGRVGKLPEEKPYVFTNRGGSGDFKACLRVLDVSGGEDVELVDRSYSALADRLEIKNFFRCVDNPRPDSDFYDSIPKPIHVRNNFQFMVEDLARNNFISKSEMFKEIADEYCRENGLPIGSVSGRDVNRFVRWRWGDDTFVRHSHNEEWVKYFATGFDVPVENVSIIQTFSSVPFPKTLEPKKVNLNPPVLEADNSLNVNHQTGAAGSSVRRVCGW